MIYLEYIEDLCSSIWEIDDDITKERVISSTLGISKLGISNWFYISDRELWASGYGFTEINMLTPEDLFLEMI